MGKDANAITNSSANTNTSASASASTQKTGEAGETG